MTGQDVKRQVMNELEAWPTVGYNGLRAALAPCIVLTAEEAEGLRKAIFHPGGSGPWDEALALLTFKEASDADA
jgi:hypothetical protein